MFKFYEELDEDNNQAENAKMANNTAQNPTALKITDK
jgi:hypothetical protein